MFTPWNEHLCSGKFTIPPKTNVWIVQEFVVLEIPTFSESKCYKYCQVDNSYS